ncbi:MAG: SpoIIIAC/SpoIIIAD family protein [Oscillospiraceae bacterium]
MEVTTIIVISVLASILVLFLKSYRPDFALVTATAAGCVVLFLILIKVVPLFESFQSILEKSGVNSAHFKIVFKALGICYLSQAASDICRDFGQTSLAGKVDLAGKVAIVTLTIPIISSIIETAVGLIK